MKKVLSLFLALVVLSLALLSLTSCSTISGKYSLYLEEEGEVPVTLHFTHGGKIHVYEGEYGLFKDPIDTIFYKIEDGKIYTWNTHTEEKNAKGTDFARGEDEVGEYITLGKVTYYKI